MRASPRTATLATVTSGCAARGAPISRIDPSFYVERDTRPARWYPTRNGKVARDDDLPRRYRHNLEVEAPFAPVNGKPALDDREIADIVAFLKTLTDGWQPNAPTNPPDAAPGRSTVSPR